MIALLVAVGAVVGAPARYLTDRAVRARHRGPFPWGTLVVNVAASFVLGVVTGAPVSTEISALVATGFCGALSTFSTFSYEMYGLTRDGAWRPAVTNVALSVAAGIGAVAVGFEIGSAF